MTAMKSSPSTRTQNRIERFIGAVSAGETERQVLEELYRTSGTRFFQLACQQVADEKRFWEQCAAVFFSVDGIVRAEQIDQIEVQQIEKNWASLGHLVIPHGGRRSVLTVSPLTVAEQAELQALPVYVPEKIELFNLLRRQIASGSQATLQATSAKSADKILRWGESPADSLIIQLYEVLLAYEASDVRLFTRGGRCAHVAAHIGEERVLISEEIGELDWGSVDLEGRGRQMFARLASAADCEISQRRIQYGNVTLADRSGQLQTMRLVMAPLGPGDGGDWEIGLRVISQAGFIPLERMNLHPRIYRSITGRWPTQEEPPEQVLSEMERIADTEMLCLLDLETAISLVAGSMNSGKSMLLQNVGLLRARRGHHVHSFESPIERLVEGIFQYEVTEQNDWLGWSRFATRNDPGDIIFGEINDRDTAQRILGFANGKLVLTTLHTNRAVRFTERLRNLLRGESERDGHAQIAAFVSTTGYVYCQRLLPRVCPHCSTVEAVPEPLREALQWQIRLWRRPGPGCGRGTCRSEGPLLGYLADRVPLTEAIYVPALAEHFLRPEITVFELLAAAEVQHQQTYRRTAAWMLDAERRHGGLVSWQKVAPHLQEDRQAMRLLSRREEEVTL
ncbi:gll3884 [Gloeobacter violaceus PCC 7421]|uniref:Gll3884 protein n=2 Tax=Gloeobacter violaceus TaxID=33072 RepID=Q7NEJ5_GLOVI|nr:gll3884 [Gloeobacter violaceus PCC 7421]